jgi:hypothetical protein
VHRRHGHLDGVVSCVGLGTVRVEIDDASMVADRRINLMFFLCVRRWMDLRPVLRRTQNL